jgi:tRNA(Arg) A34 adenosine deaminase TadA
MKRLIDVTLKNKKPMTTEHEHHSEASNPTALHEEVQALKDAYEMMRLKEAMIVNIMMVEEREMLEEVAATLRDVLFPKKPRGQGPPPEQGNG